MSEPQIKSVAGDIAGALANGRHLLASHPAAAALQARTILQAAPRNSAAMRLLAFALTNLGEHSRAREALGAALGAAANEPDVAAANRAINEGRHGEVGAIVAARLADDPRDPVGLLMHGEAATRSGRFGEAIEHLRRALDVAPFYTPARMALARAHYRRFEPREALAALGTADDPASIRFRATLLAETGDFAAALALLGDLVTAHPGEAGLHIQLGDTLRTLGDKPAAAAAYRAAIAAAPDLGRAWWSLVALDPGLPDPREISAMAACHAAASNADNRMHLAFALGRVRDQQGDYEAAFALFAEANRLHRTILPWNPGPFLQRNHELAAALAAGTLAREPGQGLDEPGPIFIVGLPRSGSTLLEQMLSRHSGIAAGGELPVIPALLREAAASRGLDPETDIVRLLQEMPAAQTRALGSEYLRRARQRCTGPEPYFTDKLPHNWAEQAFIRLILPRAKFIDIRRDLADCMVSNFALLFSPGHPACYDLADFAAYARAYAAGSQAFATAAPDTNTHVRYEELVTQPERVLREVLAFLELPFEADCLAFDRSTRAVATASSQQVRQPLSTGSIGSWHRFAPWLGTLPGELAAISPRA